MNKITNITKRKIRDLFSSGVDVGILGTEMRSYHFSGNLTDGEFLARLYDTKSLPSNDSRFKDADGDIWQHTENNDDYETDWVFDDDRFPLKNGTDEDYLRFLMEVLSPEVRIDGEVLTKIIEQLTLLLRIDGYELYIGSYISNQPVYTWGLLTEKEISSSRFLPFSIRNEELLKEKRLSSISKKNRKAIYDLMVEFNEPFYTTSETGFECLTDCISEVFEIIKSYYTPMAYNSAGIYTTADNFENFIMSSAPKNVFDAIELYPLNANDKLSFPARINQILNSFTYRLIDGKMRPVSCIVRVQKNAYDKSLKELIEEANAYVQTGSTDDLQRALEKIWDAYERAKSMLHEDKKRSISLLIDKLSEGDSTLKEKINDLMNQLYWIGNNYQIRHFEKDKLKFPSDNLKLFYYNICASFLNLCIDYLNENSLLDIK